MVFIKPFPALHPTNSTAKELACFPYDVAHESEVREFVQANPNSFLRVTRPEADFNGETSVDPEAMLAAAKQNLEDLIVSGRLVQDTASSMYIYRLETETHTQTGVVACCSLDEYGSGVIKRHERTRPDKVTDRTAHMVALRAQTGLILLAFKGSDATKRAIENAVEKDPIFEFTCASNIRHTIWRVGSSDSLVDAFADLDSLYIADGHHRIEAALNARNILRSSNGSELGNEHYDLVMAGMFPADELKILPYNRVVKGIGDQTADEFLAKLSDHFVVTETDGTAPDDHGVIHMYFRKRWHRLKFNVNYLREPNPIERLDVTILQKYLLEPILGIGDPSTDDRLGFVGGARGIKELERIVDSGEAAVAFALYATTIDDLLAVSDMGEIMPPKSTWFEPKLKDGLIVHLI